MTYFNRTPDDFHAVGEVFSGAYNPDELTHYLELKEGLYYRQQEFPGLQQAMQSCTVGETPWSDLSLDAYQAWSESAWKRPHNTAEASERFAEKAMEETWELQHAINVWRGETNTPHLVEEIGDVQWVFTAFATNGGAILSDALKQRLWATAAGTKAMVDGKLVEPSWRDTAAQLSIRSGSLKVGDLDVLLEAGCIPNISPAMNIYEDDEADVRGYILGLAAFSAALRCEAEKQTEAGHGIYLETQPQIAERLAGYVGEVTFYNAAIAHHYGTTFAAVIEANVRKIESRIATRTIDKTDVGRS